MHLYICDDVNISCWCWLIYMLFMASADVGGILMLTSYAGVSRFNYVVLMAFADVG